MRNSILLIAVLMIPISALAQEKLTDHRKLRPVYFTDVKLTDSFFAPRIETNRKVSIPHNIAWCEKARIPNFVKAAGKMEGKFEGIYFDDSDVYKVIEGASYSLAAHPDPELDKKLDEIIAKFAAAQQPDGYLNTYYTLAEPGKRWTNCKDKHELYIGGHLIEGAVAHHRATGKKNFLDIAIKFADHIDSIFGPDKRHDVCGHEEIELALIKLYHLTGNAKYYRLAEFFLNMRGNAAARPKLYGEYCQDHMPVREQREIGGHAVRAMYLYSAVADAAAISNDAGFIAAMDAVWQDVTKRKMYITGGIGPSAHNEGFTVAYDLPNESAYAETCASIGMALWNHRLNLLHADAKYFDEVERVLYNGLLSGVNLEGNLFFYVNPLASKGRHHRQPWFGCACCPSNMVRFIPSIPGYVYATSGNALYVNLYVNSAATCPISSSIGNAIAESKMTVKQETNYPWEGKVKITVERPTGASITDLMLRIPGWAKTFDVLNNGNPMKIKPGKNGYVCLGMSDARTYTVELVLAMPVERIRCNPLAKANVGRAAAQRGPIVYCLEGVDNKDLDLTSIAIAEDAAFASEHKADLLGGVTVLKTKAAVAQPGVWENSLYGSAKPKAEKEVTFVPYHAWDNREPGQMIVWLPTDILMATRIVAPTIAGRAKVSASQCWRLDTLEALNDQIEPKSSNDHSIPRMTWWDHKGTSEWVQYEFKQPTRVSSAEVYFFEDNAGCRLPESWNLQYKDGETWKDVEAAGTLEAKANRFNKATFKPVTTTGLRLTVKLKEKYSSGVLEWKVN